MREQSSGKRFAFVAIEKGFITKEQFLEAMGVQIESELMGAGHKFLGTILHGLGYMKINQIEEVLAAL